MLMSLCYIGAETQEQGRNGLKIKVHINSQNNDNKQNKYTL